MSGIDKWSTDIEVKAGVWKCDVYRGTAIDVVADYEGDTGILLFQLAMKGVVHEVSFDRAVPFNAKRIFKSLAGFYRQPYVWYRRIDEC